MLRALICVFKKHTVVDIGGCPFTGKSYEACTRCGKTTAKA
jgi:hypothetical protein